MNQQPEEGKASVKCTCNEFTEIYECKKDCDAEPPIKRSKASVDVLEGNKIIAEFMGEAQQGTTTQLNYWLSIPEKSVKRWVNIMDLKYHSSWDWLMPVVRKVIDLKNNSFNNDLLLYKYISGRLTPILNEMLKVDIQNTWYCVVQFITWYNNQNKQS